MSSNSPPNSPPITLDQLTALNDEIVALVRAGVPLEANLAEIGGDLPGALGRITTMLAERAKAGEPLGQLIAQSSAQFPPVYRAVIEAGLRRAIIGGVGIPIGQHSPPGPDAAEHDIRRLVSVRGGDFGLVEFCIFFQVSGPGIGRRLYGIACAVPGIFCGSGLDRTRRDLLGFRRANIACNPGRFGLEWIAAGNMDRDDGPGPDGGKNAFVRVDADLFAERGFCRHIGAAGGKLGAFARGIDLGRRGLGRYAADIRRPAGFANDRRRAEPGGIRRAIGGLSAAYALALAGGLAKGHSCAGLETRR